MRRMITKAMRILVPSDAEYKSRGVVRLNLTILTFCGSRDLGLKLEVAQGIVGGVLQRHGLHHLGHRDQCSFSIHQTKVGTGVLVI